MQVAANQDASTTSQQEKEFDVKCEYRLDDVAGGELLAVIGQRWSKQLSVDECIKELKDVISDIGNTVPLLVKCPPGFYTEAKRFETPQDGIDFLVTRKAERLVDSLELSAVEVKDCPPSSWVVWIKRGLWNVKAVPFTHRDEAEAYYKSSWGGRVLCAERTYELMASGPWVTVRVIRKSIADAATSFGTGVNVACDHNQHENVVLAGKLGVPMTVPGGPENVLSAWIGMPGSEWTEVPNAGMMATSLLKRKLRTGSYLVVVHPDDIAAQFALQPTARALDDEVTILVQTRRVSIEFKIEDSGNEQVNGYYCSTGLDKEGFHTYANIGVLGVTVRWVKSAWVLQASDHTMCTCHNAQKTVPFFGWVLDPRSPDTLVNAPTLKPARLEDETLKARGDALVGAAYAFAYGPGILVSAGLGLIAIASYAASRESAGAQSRREKSIVMNRNRWADFHNDEETEISIRPDTPWEDFKCNGLLQHLRHHDELAGIIRDLEQVVIDVETKMQELRTRPESRDTANKLDDDELAGIVLYTYDNGTGQDGNLYYEENKDLRKRCEQARLAVLRRWGAHVYYTLRGLSKLDNIERLVYRGLPDKDRVGQDYLKGRPIQYGAWTSTTTNLEKAKGGFAGSNGVILKLDIRTGKDIHELSMFDEGEVLLTPNHQFVVTRELYEESGHWFVDLLETRSGELKS